MRTMGNVDTSWLAMKRFLGQRAAKEDILRFDARMITAAISADLERRFFSLSLDPFLPYVRAHSSQISA